MDYYKRSIDAMIKCAIPVVIYAHTSPVMPEVPFLLEQVADYAVMVKKLRQVSMTDYFTEWTEKVETGHSEKSELSSLPEPGTDFAGEPVVLRMSETIKCFVKRIIDFEKVTPESELKCGIVKKMLKLLFRKIFG